MLSYAGRFQIYYLTRLVNPCCCPSNVAILVVEKIAKVPVKYHHNPCPCSTAILLAAPRCRHLQVLQVALKLGEESPVLPLLCKGLKMTSSQSLSCCVFPDEFNVPWPLRHSNTSHPGTQRSDGGGLAFGLRASRPCVPNAPISYGALLPCPSTGQ